MFATVVPRTYCASGKRYYTAECVDCGLVLNSGHHYRDMDSAQRECDRHNEKQH